MWQKWGVTVTFDILLQIPVPSHADPVWVSALQYGDWRGIAPVCCFFFLPFDCHNVKACRGFWNKHCKQYASGDLQRWHLQEYISACHQLLGMNHLCVIAQMGNDRLLFKNRIWKCFSMAPHHADTPRGLCVLSLICVDLSFSYQSHPKVALLNRLRRSKRCLAYGTELVLLFAGCLFFSSPWYRWHPGVWANMVTCWCRVSVKRRSPSTYVPCAAAWSVSLSYICSVTSVSFVYCELRTGHRRWGAGCFGRRPCVQSVFSDNSGLCTHGNYEALHTFQQCEVWNFTAVTVTQLFLTLFSLLDQMSFSHVCVCVLAVESSGLCQYMGAALMWSSSRGLWSTMRFSRNMTTWGMSQSHHSPVTLWLLSLVLPQFVFRGSLLQCAL